MGDEIVSVSKKELEKLFFITRIEANNFVTNFAETELNEKDRKKLEKQWLKFMEDKRWIE